MYVYTYIRINTKLLINIFVCYLHISNKYTKFVRGKLTNKIKVIKVNKKQNKNKSLTGKKSWQQKSKQKSKSSQQQRNC